MSVSLPPMRTKLGTALEDFTLSLVHIHTICKAELEEERNTTTALRSKKISGKYFCVSILLFNLVLLTCCVIIYLPRK